MPSLNLINSNPFVDSYRAAEKDSREQVAADQSLLNQQQAVKNQQQLYDVTAEQRPYKLSDVKSASDLAASNARLAQGTETSKIGASQSASDLAKTNADKAAYD